MEGRNDYDTFFIRYKGSGCSLVPRPSPSFPSLAVQFNRTAIKQQEAGGGPGNKATLLFIK